MAQGQGGRLGRAGGSWLSSLPRHQDFFLVWMSFPWSLALPTPRSYRGKGAGSSSKGMEREQPTCLSRGIPTEMSPACTGNAGNLSQV